jgi:hypothetical protein
MKETQRRLINFAKTAALYPFGPKRAFHCTIYKVSTDDSLNEDVRCNFRCSFHYRESIHYRESRS